MQIKFDVSKFDATAKALIDQLKGIDRTLKDKVVKEIVTKLADRLLEESVKRAPIDEGFLIESHERVVAMESSGGFGAYEWVGYVYIPANSPAADYAMYMHEGHYKLGKASQAKQDGSSVVVGRKFLERALTENEKQFGNYIKIRLTRFFKDGI